jgi:class 3 adenylate cyclase/tetratricopeptide (TPR) repeat protein
MVRCPSCSAEWPEGARFCGACGATLDRSCEACGEPLPPGARFCLSCGTPVSGGPAAAPTHGRARAAEERRAVTILFADLVGFTERSDRADPEDVRTTLLPFHAHVKQDIERYGGTLDKFIGDAVMGVFGAPVAHEDDPLRAVRAALRILRTIDELRERDPSLQIRVAVNTGEAVVALGDGPQVGEAVAGDVVNTASRMQALAPPGGIVIGETTYRHVRDVVEAERLPPARVKGKAEPIVVWQVMGERDPSTTARVTTTRFVGRERELAMLTDLLDRTTAMRAPHVVTITGEPGIGKSRLVDELRMLVDSRTAWFEGRCLPYGETVTLSPVADLVRAAAGIGASDPATVAAEELRRAFVDAGVGHPEANGLAGRLEPALGLAEADDADAVTASEMGTALGALLTGAPRPVVVAIHDLHWADVLVLDVLTHALRHLGDRPALVIGTARPELHDRDARWPPPALEATTLRLAPLSPEQTESLVASLVAEVSLGAETRASLLQRAAGNPLFALEYIRMLADDAPPSGGVPETIQSLIAARIDAVPPSSRSRLLDAAVAGTEFWPALLSRLAGSSEREVRDDITGLVQRGLVRPAPTTLEDHPAFAFTHDLIREVAYARIPRAERARRHLATAEWIDETLGERRAERADVLAQHFSTAFDLASSARAEDLIRRARTPAVRWLTEAGRRAMAADPRGAFTWLDRAASMAAPDSVDLADALSASGAAGWRSGLLAPSDVLDRYEGAASIRRALGHRRELGDILIRMSSQLAIVGRTAESRTVLAEAIELLETGSPDRRLAGAYAHRAEASLFAGDREAAMADAARTLAILGEDSIDEFAVMALHLRGDARCSLGDREGLLDLERALTISEATQRSADIITSESYVADWMLAFDGPTASWPHYGRSIATAEESGVLSQGLWSKAGALFSLYELGRDEDVLRISEEILALGKDRLDATVWVFAQVLRTEVLLDMGRTGEVVPADELLELARAAQDPQTVAPALLAAARIALVEGDVAGAERGLREFASVTRDVAPEFREATLARAARVAVALRRSDVLRELIDASSGELPHHAHNLASARAALLELGGRRDEARDAYLEAAAGWDAFGSPREAAFARIGAERCGGTG